LETIAKRTLVQARMTIAIFDFEEPNEGLVWVPLAARRALDRAGIRLSLEAWQALPLGARQELVAAGAGTAVALDVVERVVGGLPGAPERMPPFGEPADVPAELRAAVGTFAAPLERAWPGLSPLERYALVKLARGARKDPGAASRRLKAACEGLLSSPKSGISA
jgi:hypothetical protein